MRHPRRRAGRGPDLLSEGEPDGEFVTVVASRVVRAGQEDAFRDWARRIDKAAARHPGHRGNVRLEQEGGVFHLVYQFDRRDHLDAWEQSDAFRDLTAEGDRFSVAKRQTRSGRTAWFTLPGEASAAKWKKFLMTWVAVYPTLLLLNGAMSLVPVQLPKLAQLTITSPLLTAVLTWIILPRVSRWTKTWVLTGSDGELKQPN